MVFAIRSYQKNLRNEMPQGQATDILMEDVRGKMLGIFLFPDFVT